MNDIRLIHNVRNVFGSWQEQTDCGVLSPENVKTGFRYLKKEFNNALHISIDGKGYAFTYTMPEDYGNDIVYATMVCGNVEQHKEMSRMDAKELILDILSGKAENNL